MPKAKPPPSLKTTHHTNIKNNDGIERIVITHPFHPDNGKEFKYLGQANERVRCLDKQGNIRLFPINSTNLHIPAIGKRAAEGSFFMPVDDLLALKELVDQLLNPQVV